MKNLIAILNGQEVQIPFSSVERSVEYIKELHGIDVSHNFVEKDGYLIPRALLSGNKEESPPPSPPTPQFVTTNINAIKVDYTYDDQTSKSYYFFGNQDKPATDGAVTSGVPIRATTYFVNDYLTRNNINTVKVLGNALLQQPSIKSIPKGDLTSKMKIEMPNVTGVSVVFGFEDRAGIASYSIYDKDTGEYEILSGQIDLHSTSDDLILTTKSVELANNLDETKTWVLEIGHTGTANPTVFDSGQNHPIYVADVQFHRRANSNNSIVEHVSNTGFLNNSFIDNGTQNSLTGRENYVEFFMIQNEIADGVKNTFRIKSSAMDVKSVEIDNGRGFRELDRNLDWVVVSNSATDEYDISVELSFVPKNKAAIKIIYDRVSFALTRKLEINQPRTYDGKYDRYTNIYVQNEATYIELNQNTRT